MRIALLPGGLYEDPAYSRVLSNLRNELTLLGHDCCIIRAPGRVSGVCLTPPPAADFADIPPLPRGYFSLPRLFRLIFALIRIFKSRKIEIAHLHFSGCFRPWFTALPPACAAAKTKLVVTFQDYNHPDFPSPSLFERFFLKIFMAAASALTCVSGMLRAEIAKDFPERADRISIIPNGACAPAARTGPAESASRPLRGPYIFSAGRLAPYKGMDILAMAYAQALEKGLKSRLIIAGADFQGGRLRGIIDKLDISDKVSLAGHLDFREISLLMRDCLFFALLSRRESFGMAILEAMTHGKAVLISGACGAAEFLTDEEDALIIDPFRIQNAAEALLRLEHDASLRQRLGTNAAATAKKFDWKLAALNYAENAYS